MSRRITVADLYGSARPSAAELFFGALSAIGLAILVAAVVLGMLGGGQ